MKTGEQVEPNQLDNGRAAPPLRTARRGILASPRTKIVLYRLAMSVPLLFLVSILTFVLVTFIPGDPASAVLGADATPEALAQLRDSLGLDEPLYQQYWSWLTGALQGDLGVTLNSGEDVASMVLTRIPVSLSLMVGSLILSLVVGVALGVFSAVRGGAVGKVVDAFALVGFSLPSFWIGAELIILFAVKIQIFPATGYVTFADSPSDWIKSITLPVVALSFGGVAALAKQTREAMLDTLGSEYIMVARATGIPARSIILRHALKNTGVRIATILGLQAVTLLSATVVVENVFALPGLGTLAATATAQNDLQLIQGVLIFYTLMVIAINLVIDIAYSWLNPRLAVRS